MNEKQYVYRVKITQGNMVSFLNNEYYEKKSTAKGLVTHLKNRQKRYCKHDRNQTFTVAIFELKEVFDED